jgi:hypothetical protein
MEIAKMREQDQISTDLVFRDPYLLDFLGLQGAYSERDLEAVILAGMERFLLEMGDGFCFVARQKRPIIGPDDFYIDLLFYHRKLRRLVAVELKLERFQAAHKGQMELYLRWLDRYERQPGEDAPIGLILCASVNREEIEVLQRSPTCCIKVGATANTLSAALRDCVGMASISSPPPSRTGSTPATRTSA